MRNGFQPPATGDERITSITAGVIRSSPRARLVDVLPAIRVEYDAGARNSRRDSGAGVGRHPETRAARG